ncbi:MAG: NAD(+)/NADH kinase [Candidatus Acidiferrales bacterium]
MSESIRTVGIISRPRRADISKVVPPLLEWLIARGVKVFVDPETAASIGTVADERPREELPGLADLLIVLGGDGTLLAAARLENARNVPILPVNLGGLGFLTSVTLGELYAILDQVFAGENRISERVMLGVEVTRGGNTIERQRALNDAVINKGAVARIIDFELTINGEFICCYKADGLIISTPTGSTAYSLSAGGPIVYPSVEALVVTPICPHTLTNRPLVVPDAGRIEVGFNGDERVYLTVDGQVGRQLEPGDRVVVVRAGEKLHLVRPARQTYFEVLRDKLKWGNR